MKEEERLKQSLAILRNNGTKDGILDGLLAGTELSIAWTTDRHVLHRQMANLLQEWSTDRSEGDGAYAITYAANKAILNTTPREGQADEARPKQSETEVTQSVEVTLRKWKQLASQAQKIQSKLKKRYPNPKEKN